ncbi:MAG: asparagine synthase (glutamine-hydrolyzing), partial [Arenimonas sp.]
MCGIAGWLYSPGTEPAPAVLDNMAHAIRHRGPDDRGFFRDPEKGVSLAHLRLSIIDLSSASHQPMLDAAGELSLVYNGELYNFRQLRAELQLLGHTFVSQGDSEVVLKSYLQWGTQCFSRFAGMFAIALWDGNAQTLHLARDPMGMKPLYYTKYNGGFVFASEVKAFAELPDFKLQPSELGLQQYLEFGYVFDKHQTFLQGVYKLAPGTRMEVHAGVQEKTLPFFSVTAPDPNDLRGEAERVDELRDVLSQVTSEHLIADVPVGLLLSGGLDSSVIASLAARQGQLLTISMGFADSIIDERPQAKQVSNYIGSRHLEILISPEQVMA